MILSENTYFLLRSRTLFATWAPPTSFNKGTSCAGRPPDQSTSSSLPPKIHIEAVSSVMPVQVVLFILIFPAISTVLSIFSSQQVCSALANFKENTQLLGICEP